MKQFNIFILKHDYFKPTKQKHFSAIKLGLDRHSSLTKTQKNNTLATWGEFIHVCVHSWLQQYSTVFLFSSICVKCHRVSNVEKCLRKLPVTMGTWWLARRNHDCLLWGGNREEKTLTTGFKDVYLTFTFLQKCNMIT